MAKKVYDELIDKNIPWDGNELTGNLPVKGTRIEEFIKSYSLFNSFINRIKSIFICQSPRK